MQMNNSISAYFPCLCWKKRRLFLHMQGPLHTYIYICRHSYLYHGKFKTYPIQYPHSLYFHILSISSHNMFPYFPKSFQSKQLPCPSCGWDTRIAPIIAPSHWIDNNGNAKTIDGVTAKWWSIHPPTHPSIHPSNLSIYQSAYLSVYLSIYLCIYLPIYLFIYLSIYLPIYLSNLSNLSIYVSIFLSIYLSIDLSIYLFIYLSN